MKINEIITALLVGVSATTAWSQESDLFKKVKAQYPDVPAIYMERSQVLNFVVAHDSLTSYTDTQESMLLLKENVESFTKHRIYGSDFEKVVNLEARTAVWNGSRYKDLPITDFKKKRDDDNAVFFDDSYFYSFSFPAVAAGNQTFLSYRTEHKDPRYLSGFFLAAYIPQLKSSFTIKASKGVELVYEVLHDDHNQIRFKKTEKGNFVYYEWVAEGIPSIHPEDESPDIAYFTPQVQYYVKSYQTSKGTRNILADLNDLYKWYGTFTTGLDQDTSPDLQAIVDGMKSPGVSEMDIVKKVFYWVQDNVRYIAFEEGMRGQIPHTGSYVFEKRYGDCKDMANMIVTMLRMAGITSYRTWIGTRDLPYRYTQWPTPLVDNHMIATYVSPDHQYYYLDATGNHTPFGMPSSMIQGKEALIGISPEKFEIREVPVIAHHVNYEKDSITLQLDKSGITGAGRKTFEGYQKVWASYKLDKSSEESTKNNVIRLIGKGSNKFYLDKFNITDLSDRDKPLQLDYQFRVGDYTHQAGNEVYINLNLEKDYYNQYISASRESPKENDYRFTKDEVYVFNIPEGYNVTYLPPNKSHVSNSLGFDIKYTQKSGVIIMEKKIYQDFLILPPNQFQDWNASVKALSEAYRESVILNKNENIKP